MDEAVITWRGYWGDGDQDDPDLPEPWIDFFLLAHSNEIGDQRAATVEDLRLAGFVPTADLDRANRVIVAARENQAAIYCARCLLHEAQRFKNRENLAQVQHIISEAEQVLWDAWNAQNTALLGLTAYDAPGGDEQ